MIPTVGRPAVADAAGCAVAYSSLVSPAAAAGSTGNIVLGAVSQNFQLLRQSHFIRQGSFLPEIKGTSSYIFFRLRNHRPTFGGIVMPGGIIQERCDRIRHFAKKNF
jgi:hypothetical protein